MGLIKAGAGSVGGVLADQWREYFYCNSLSAGVLAAKGVKRTNNRTSNTKGEDNIITNGSVIAVNEGQCMLLVEQGKIVEVCAEAGEFIYDNSTEPSIFYGGLGKGILDTFKAIGKRFTFGGDTGKDQRVYYINTKEIVGNKYGTPKTIPFRVVDTNIGLDIDIAIRCHGEYSYRITNPLLFYTNVCGNVDNAYTRDMLDSQQKSEFLTALQPAIGSISRLGIRYSALPQHTLELSEALNNELSSKWRDIRGVEVVSVGVSSVSATEEDENMIKELQKNAVFRNPNMAAAHLVGAQAEAMQAAAGNASGAMQGFMGFGMAQQAGGANIANLFAMGQQQQPQQPQQPQQQSTPQEGWTCSCGHSGNTSKFCSECGKPKPQEGWTCSCGAVNKGKFCQECGKPKPQGAPLYKCDKCGWEPEDPTNPPKFCPECGDVFDDNDINK